MTFGRRGPAFAVDQLARGASELRDLVVEAWTASATASVGWKPVAVKLPNTSYYLGRETLIVAEKRPRTAPPPPAGSPSPPVTSMARWRKKDKDA